MAFKKEIRDQLAEQKASNFQEFGIVPNVADAGRPGTGYYDKNGKFVIYGPHHLGAGYVGPAAPWAGYGGRHPGARGGYGGVGYGHGGHPGYGHPGAWGHPGYAGAYAHPGHPGFPPGDLDGAAYARRYAASPVRLYGSPARTSRR